MIDSYFRAPYQRFLINPLLKTRWIANASPFKISLLGGILGLAIPFTLLIDQPSLALLFLALSGFCDTLDGSVARSQAKTSPKGAVLDITLDRTIELGVILGLYAVDPGGRALLSLLMLGAIFLCVTTFLVVGVFTENQSEKSFHYSPGIMERGEAFLFFALLILLPSLFPLLAALFILLTFLTALFRVVQFIKH